MRVLIVAGLAGLAGLALLGSACGKHRSPPAAFHALTASNDAGVRVTVLGAKEHAKSLVLTLRIDNTSGEPLLFKNAESKRVSGIAIVADGHEARGADAGHQEAGRSPAARLRELPAGTEANFDAKWSFDPPLAHESYPWSMTVGNLFAGDRHLTDVTLTWTPEVK
jgi:hypothetical protein